MTCLAISDYLGVTPVLKTRQQVREADAGQQDRHDGEVDGREVQDEGPEGDRGGAGGSEGGC